MENWSVGDIFVRKDVAGRFSDEDILVVDGVRYVKSPKTGEIQFYTVKKVDVAGRRLVAEEGGAYIVDVCKKVLQKVHLNCAKSP